MIKPSHLFAALMVVLLSTATASADTYPKEWGDGKFDKSDSFWHLEIPFPTLSEDYLKEQLEDDAKITAKALKGKASYQFVLARQKVLFKNYKEGYTWMRKAAENGCADAYYGLGYCQYYGYADDGAARHSWQKAVEKAKPYYRDLAACALGLSEYFDKNDPTTARLWLTKGGGKESAYVLAWLSTDPKERHNKLTFAKSMGLKKAAVALAMLYHRCVFNDIDSAESYRMAVNTLEEANRGYRIDPKDLANINTLLAAHYQYGLGVEQDLKKAVELLKVAAPRNVFAALEMGIIYLKGWYGEPQDQELAFDYFQEAAKRDKSGEAYLKLGYCYHMGTGVHQSNKAAMDYYQKSLNLYYNNPIALYHNMAASSDSVDKIKYWEKEIDCAATTDFHKKMKSETYSNMGYYYYEGIGVAVDYKKAFSYQKNAYLLNPNDPYVLYHLGKHFYYGKGVAKDYKKAVDYLQKSISSRIQLTAALTLLSKCYRYGRGVEQDEKKADEYMKEAAKYGDKGAQKVLQFENEPL